MLSLDPLPSLMLSHKVFREEYAVSSLMGQTLKWGGESGQIPIIILCLTHHEVCSTDMTYACGCPSVHQYAWLPLVLGDIKNIQSRYTSTSNVTIS